MEISDKIRAINKEMEPVKDQLKVLLKTRNILLLEKYAVEQGFYIDATYLYMGIDKYFYDGGQSLGFIVNYRNDWGGDLGEIEKKEDKGDIYGLIKNISEHDFKEICEQKDLIYRNIGKDDLKSFIPEFLRKLLRIHIVAPEGLRPIWEKFTLEGDDALAYLLDKYPIKHNAKSSNDD